MELNNSIGIKDLTCTLKFNQPAGILYYLKYNYNLLPVDEDGYGRMEINPVQKVVHLQSHRVSGSYSKEQSNDLKRFGIDHLEIIKSNLNEEMNRMEEKDIYNKFLNLGQETEIKERTKFQTLMNKWFGFTPKVRIKEDLDILNLVFKSSQKILQKTRIRPGDFIIVSSAIGAKLSAISDFVYTSNVSSSTTTGITQIGTIRGIRVFVNSYLGYKDLKVIVGSTTKEQELGVYFVESEMGEEIEEMELFPGLEFRIILTKRRTVVDTENAEDKFYTLELSFERHNIFTHLFQKIKDATVSLIKKK
jgi:hypothetical protein